MNNEENPTCPNCKQEVDPDLCWCGISHEDHNSWEEGHTFVPAGCRCGFNSPDNPGPEDWKREFK